MAQLALWSLVPADATPGPAVKWAGGKTRLLRELLARLPARWGRYFEPFAGGAALFFRLAGEGRLAPGLAVLSDANGDLIGCYRELARDHRAVAAHLRELVAGHSRDAYYAVRAAWNEGRPCSPAARAATMLYLNRACFNGLWRVNRAGAMNTPVGSGSLAVPDLEGPAAALARAELRCADYREIAAEAVRGDLVYFDPPYDPLTPTSSFTSYTAGVFGLEQQSELSRLALALRRRGVHVVVSNHDTPLVRELYSESSGWRVDAVQVRRSVGARSRGEAREVIVTSERR